MEFYPLKFKPVFHYRIWGGDQLKTSLNKEYDQESIGESWEISAVPDSETVVANGVYAGATINNLIERFKDAFLGKSVYDKFNGEFPLLIKFIDAKKPLSIQVHPNNDIARERHGSFGKNEMWYIMPSYKDATITVGFKEEVDRDSYQKHLENNTLTEVLNEFKVKAGDAFYIPTGRIHAIGAGVMLAEIQQSSDVTYRIYDYDRKDVRTGQTRELHTDLALDAIDFNLQTQYHTDYSRKKNQPNKLINSPYFKTNFLKIKGVLERDLSDINSFTIYMCVKGSATLVCQEENYSLVQGECILLPAGIDLITLDSKDAQCIEVYL
ncbi:type I phosphomannose isomerase catalytic subunit [Nonlabens sp. Asnod2-A12]|uniref:type I phosphomannose isomerase catalytic subunit n=1 Tax=Nonlabens sp. Asnod2-A12 TaxID=3160578 RepID=UPI00386EB7A6